MAASEYYLGSAAVPPRPPPHYHLIHHNHTNNRPHKHTHLSHHSPTGHTPSYPFQSAQQPQLQMQLQHQQAPPGYHPQPQSSQPPYPSDGGPLPASYSNMPPQNGIGTHQPQYQYSNGNGNGNAQGFPLQPQRSHSQPPRVRFSDEYKSDSSSSSSVYSSKNESSRRRHQRRRRNSSPSGDRTHGKEKHGSKSKTRDTFLGAGAGGLVGDLIFPGLGTAAGVLIGGYGGRKRGEKRRRSGSEGR